jgi:hypothetical protein
MDCLSTTPVIIQPDISTPVAECGLFVRVVGGHIARVRGIGGLTQAEDSAEILQQDYTSFRWRDFLWMHYSALVVDVTGPPTAVMSIQGKTKTCEFRLDELSTQALRTVIGTEGAVLVAIHQPEEYGTFRIYPDDVDVGTSHCFTLEYMVGEEGIRAGGGIRVRTPFSSWTRPTLSDASVELVSSGRATIETRLDHCHHNVFGSTYTITLGGGELAKGDIMRLRLDADGNGIKVQTYAKKDVFFTVSTDTSGRGIFCPVSLSNTPRVRVKSGPARRIRLAIPMIVSVGENFTARAIALDEHYNPIEDDNVREVDLRASLGDATAATASIRLEGGRNGQCRIRLEEPGWYVFTATSEVMEQARLVVKCVSAPDHARLYWGAIHGHTDMSDGEFPPDDYYAYGRDIGLVDFCSVADHDWELVEHERNRRRGGLAHIEELVRKYHEPGNYVTITAYEWMSPEGHINIYYNNDRIGNPAYIGNVSILDRVEAPTVKKLIELYKDRDDVVLIPHSSHGQAWVSFDDCLMPSVEIYSCWGSSEYKLGPIGSGMQEGLLKGYKFGFISGADSHHGSPGHTGRPSKYQKLCCREGFAAVYATELTREAIFDAFRRRSCYATTAERILLEFSVNDVEMGAELAANTGDALIFKGCVGGTSSVETIELICDGEVMVSSFGSSIIEHFSFESSAIRGEHYYYLRATQSDGEKAWSSPIWVKSS